jgi:MFS family permease
VSAPQGRDLISRTALFPATVMFTLALTYGTVLSFLPLMAVSRGIGGFEIFFTVYALALIAVRAAGGSLSDRVGRAAVVIPGMVLAAVGMVLVAMATSLTGLLVAAVLYGLGFGAVNPALMALTVDRCGLANRGAAMATFSGSFDLGIGVGSVLLGYVLQLSDFGTMYLAAAGVAVGGLVIFVMGTWRGAARASAGSCD